MTVSEPTVELDVVQLAALERLEEIQRETAAARSRKGPLSKEDARLLTDALRETLNVQQVLRPLASTAASPLRRPSVYTYFIQVDEPSGPIKIGCASDPQARLLQLQTASPFDLHLIGYVPGGEKLERELHRKYAHLSLRGEWFRGTEDLERDLWNMVFDYEEECLGHGR